MVISNLIQISYLSALKEKERKKELCLTLITLDQQKKTTSVKSVVSNDNFPVSVEQKKRNKTSETSTSSDTVIKTETLHHYFEKIQDEERAQEHTDSPSSPSRRNSKTFHKEAAEKNNKTQQKTLNFENYTASVNEENLMMLSLLDFAGHSAYYACHHIFISPRVFFILVVDMSKDLNTIAAQACNEQGLIYSNWTYAGTNNALLYF